MNRLRPGLRSIRPLLLSLLLLSACAAPAGQKNAGPGSTRAVPSAATSSPRAELLSDVLDRTATDSATTTHIPGSTTTRTLVGEISPSEKVVTVTNCCGLTPEMFQMNYLPEIQIWGDGRAIWTELAEDGSRKVLEGQIDITALSGLVQRAAAAGFFNWDELYTSPMSPADMPTRCIAIQTVTNTRRVCEYYEGAPQAFHDLYAELDSGLGLAGAPYQPEDGFLLAVPIPAPDAGSASLPVHSWEAAELGLSLADAAQGVWVEGPALEKAWEIVNASPWGGIVQEENAYYQLSLQIPGVSMVEPPQQPK